MDAFCVCPSVVASIVWFGWGSLLCSLVFLFCFLLCGGLVLVCFALFSFVASLASVFASGFFGGRFVCSCVFGSFLFLFGPLCCGWFGVCFFLFCSVFLFPLFSFVVLFVCLVLCFVLLVLFALGSALFLIIVLYRIFSACSRVTFFRSLAGIHFGDFFSTALSIFGPTPFLPFLIIGLKAFIFLSAEFVCHFVLVNVSHLVLLFHVEHLVYI